MSKYLIDGTGAHNLEAVVSISPMHEKDPKSGQVVKSTARLHTAGGHDIATETAYEEALILWGAKEAPEKK